MDFLLAQISPSPTIVNTDPNTAWTSVFINGGIGIGLILFGIYYALWEYPKIRKENREERKEAAEREDRREAESRKERKENTEREERREQADRDARHKMAEMYQSAIAVLSKDNVTLQRELLQSHMQAAERKEQQFNDRLTRALETIWKHYDATAKQTDLLIEAIRTRLEKAECQYNGDGK